MAFSQGNVIRIDEHRIGVVDACSGLSMLMTFLALATAAALMVRRPLLDRVALVAAAIPVALAANLFRIVLTGVLYVKAGSRAAELFYHDLAGWLMIAAALGLLWLFWAAWNWLIVEPEDAAFDVRRMAFATAGPTVRTAQAGVPVRRPAHE
jgi:exosortase